MAEKRTNRIPLNVDDTDFMLLSKAASMDERVLSDFLWARIVRPWLHGNSRVVMKEGKESNSDFAALGGPER
jgi:hypothetical protein